MSADEQMMSVYQKELHSNDNIPEDERPVSIFQPETIGCDWYELDQAIEMESAGTDDKITFTPDCSTYDLLLTTAVAVELPHIRILEEFKDKVKICWCHNVTAETINSASMILSSKQKKAFTLNGFIIASILRRYAKCDKNTVDFYLGNLSVLEKFSDQLPAVIIPLPQPWSFSYHSGFAIELKPVNSSCGGKFCFAYTFNRDILRLLRIKVKNDDGEWKELEGSSKTLAIKKYLEITDTDLKIPIPKMYGTFANMLKKDYDRRTQCGDQQNVDKKYRLVGETVMQLSDWFFNGVPNLIKFDTDVSIGIDKIDASVQSIAIGAARDDFLVKGNNANYTDSEDVYEGFTNISHIRYSRGNITQSNNEEIGTSSLLLNALKPIIYDSDSKHFTNTGNDGIIWYDFCMRPVDIVPDVSVNPKIQCSSLNIHIRTTDPVKYREIYEGIRNDSENLLDKSLKETNYRISYATKVLRKVVIRTLQDISDGTISYDVDVSKA